MYKFINRNRVYNRQFLYSKSAERLQGGISRMASILRLQPMPSALKITKEEDTAFETY